MSIFIQCFPFPHTGFYNVPVSHLCDGSSWGMHYTDMDVPRCEWRRGKSNCACRETPSLKQYKTECLDPGESSILVYMVSACFTA